MSDTPAVKVEGVTVLHGPVTVLDNVSFSVGKGEFLAIIGPNGAGKTTLIKVILGLLKPSAGSVEVFGRSVNELDPHRSKIGYVAQIHGIDLTFPVTVFETVLMGTYGKLGLWKRPGSAEREAAMRALDRVGIANLQDRPIARLSSGQRQRAFIARALANDPELLILDEPTTGVDIATTGNLYSLLRQLKNDGVTVILVSHDVGVVAAYLDSLACLNVSLVAHCRPDEVACNDALREMYGCDVAYLHHGESPHIVVEEH